MTTDYSKQTKKKLEAISGIKLTFGSMLWSIRKSEEMNQSDFAALLGVSKQYISDLEHGRRLPSPKAAYAYAKKLGYSPEHFVEQCLQDLLDKDGVKLYVRAMHEPRLSHEEHF